MWLLQSSTRFAPAEGGRVVGESDELGYVPKTRPVTPGEVAATAQPTITWPTRLPQYLAFPR